jgi:DNA-directed RNA polymerase specialized sigma24 family protein
MNQTGTESMLVILEKIKNGSNAEAEEKLWSNYFSRLKLLISRQLNSKTRRVRDEEDIALSVLNSFFRGAADGLFAKMDDQQDIWQVLCMLTKRKTIDYLRMLHAQRRGGNQVRGESVFLQPDLATPEGFDGISGSHIEPELAAIFTDECDRLFAALGDDELTRVAKMRLEGNSNDDIAQQLGRSVRSVERKLKSIRAIWLQLDMSED